MPAHTAGLGPIGGAQAGTGYGATENHVRSKVQIIRAQLKNGNPDGDLRYKIGRSLASVIMMRTVYYYVHRKRVRVREIGISSINACIKWSFFHVPYCLALAMGRQLTTNFNLVVRNVKQNKAALQGDCIAHHTH